ncbi:MAG: hypothetical protein ACKVP3_10990 [Hyphomicrobiaceae bacterium]
MSTGNLTLIERGTLIVLMAEGGPLRDRDLKGVHGIALAPRHRMRLHDLGLINVTPKPLAYALSQRGWHWVRRELSARRPDGQMGAGPLYAVLNALARYLDRHQQTLAHVFGGAAMAAQFPSPLIPEDDVEWFYKEGIHIASADSNVPADQLYNHFCRWCVRRQRQPMSATKFRRDFGELGIRKLRVARKTCYAGVALRPLE